MARTEVVTGRGASRQTSKKSGASTSKTRTKALKKTNRKGAASPRTPKGPVSAQTISPDKPIKTYPNAIEFLNSLINYERRPPARRDRKALTLVRTKRLLADLGHPEQQFRSVHIAGSKGKGSTAAMLSQMLQGNGLKVGLFTSPHILDIRERITIDDQQISRPEMKRLIQRVAKVIRSQDTDRPTFFEALTAVAFLYFAAKEVDIAVIETGLGGRLDATNAIKPEVCALTSISYDHMPQLGNSLEEIAAEKAGILKASVPVVSAPQEDSVRGVLKDVAKSVGAPLYFAGEDFTFSYRFESSRSSGPQARICVTTPTSHFDHLAVPLVGKHQAINCGVAIGVLDQLKNLGMSLDDEASVAGLAKVHLEGRMEVIREEPCVLADGAHNAASVEALMRAIGQNVRYDSMVVIFGCCADKDIDGMLKLIQLGADKIIFTRVKSPRSADPADLVARFSEVSGRMAQVAGDLAEAFVIAEKAITREDLICVTGSFYLVSEAKSLFAKNGG